MLSSDDGTFFLAHRGDLWRWSLDGYTRSFFPSGAMMIVTPRSAVQAMRAGYVPQIHPSIG